MKRKVLAAAAAVLLSSAACAQAQWWRLPTNAGAANAPGAPVAYTQATFEAAKMAAGAAFWNDDFAKVERMHDEFVRERLRSTDGRWMVEAIQQALEGIFRADQKILAKPMQKWKERIPGSTLLPVAEAVMWQRQAWNARGESGASRVPQESMQLFGERLALAARALHEAPEASRQSPIWYWAALIVAGSSGRSAQEIDAVFDEAARAFPDYQTHYYTRMNYLLPQWGGSYGEVDRFVSEAVARTAPREGDAFYAWLYVDVSLKHDGDFLEETRASWPRMKKAFEDLVARHPDPFNRNIFATFACRARDRDTTARLLRELGEGARLGYGSPGISTEACRRFAFAQA